MIELRRVESPDDLETWARVKCTVVPNEPVTVEQLVETTTDDRLLLLADCDGAVAGCGIAGLSDFGGRAFLAARVLPEFRRRGIGTALVHALADHGRSLGREGVNAFVYADDPGSKAFAEGFGLVEADFQLEQMRSVGDEPAAVAPDGIRLEAVDGRREELLHAASGRSRSRGTRTCRFPARSPIGSRCGCARRRRGPTGRSSRSRATSPSGTPA